MQQSPTESYNIEPLRFDGNSTFAEVAEIGDLVIQVWEEDGELWVYPPGRVVYLQPYMHERSKSRYEIIYLEMPKSPRLLTWEEIKNVLKSMGITRVSERISREITDPQLKHQLLGLWQ